MTKTDLSDIYRGYITCLNKQDWLKLEQFVHDEVVYNGQRIGITGYSVRQAKLARSSRWKSGAGKG